MEQHDPTVRGWQDEQPPTEETIRRCLSREELAPYLWSNGPGYVYPVHSHPYHKVIYVVEGSITFGLPDRGEALDLRAGDRLDLPPGVAHDALVGPEGVACLEAHRPP